MFAWPQHITKRHASLVGREKVEKRLGELLSHGVLLTTHYSGMGTAEDAASFALALAQKATGGLEPHPGAVVGYSSCDSNRACRSVLTSIGASKHVFGNLCDRLSVAVRDELVQTLEEHRAMLHREVDGNQDVDVTVDAGADAEAALARRRKDHCKLVGRQWSLRALDILKKETFSSQTMAWCYKCRRRCPCFPHFQEVGQRLLIEIAGTTCVAWSSMSASASGWLHNSSIDFFAWARMVQCIEPHMVIHECVEKFDPAILSFILGDKYTIESVCHSPLSMGFPSMRQRRYTVCILNGCRQARSDGLQLKMDRGYSLASFSEVAFRPTPVDGRVYLKASKSQQVRVFDEYAAIKHLPGDWCRVQGWCWLDVLCPGAQRRLMGWGRHALARGFSPAHFPFVCESHRSPILQKQ